MGLWLAYFDGLVLPSSDLEDWKAGSEKVTFGRTWNWVSCRMKG